ncbi:MAG: hypothetical protein [Bacteriophage sp.]|nr:MAG: hypothetical protein [Bacteriophage sp.]
MTPYERGKRDREYNKPYSPPYTREDQVKEYERGYDEQR